MRVRELLMAGFGVAGLMLLNLPASAQLSNDTSTFSGEVATTCSFDRLADSYPLNYYGSGNYLRGTAEFDVITNAADLKFGVSAVTTNNEPTALSGRNVFVNVGFYRVDGNNWILFTRGDKSSSGTSQSVDISQGNTFQLISFVNTNDPVSGKYFLAPGQHSYSVTLSCLL